MTNKFGGLTSFLTEFNPSAQMKLCQYRELCYFGDFPTLGGMRKEYGTNAAVSWLIPQLFDLSEYCGCKGKISEDQMQQCASVISTEFYFLKVSELMLFFHYFKSGLYGRFYGSVDPLVITTSIRDFLKERSREIERHEQEERERLKEEEAKRPKVTWEEYCLKTYGEVRPFPFKGGLKPKEKEKPKEKPEEIFEQAKWLLRETNKSVREAFDRVFKKKFGVTAQEYIDKNENK